MPPPLMFSWEIYEFLNLGIYEFTNFMKKAVLKNFAIFTGKSQASYFIKIRLQHRCFLLNIVKFLRTPISGQLLLIF